MPSSIPTPASRAGGQNLRTLGWLLASVVVVLLVSGVAWFQYRQIDRVTQASVRGRDNLIWDFYKLELQLANVQLALRNAQSHVGKQDTLVQAATDYNIFVSQVQLLQTLNSGRVMRNHASFATAMQAAQAFIETSDVNLAEPPKALTAAVVSRLLDDSAALRVPLHQLVLDAYLVENERASAQFKEIRRFTLYYGLTSTFLIVLTLWVGFLVMRNLTLSQRRQLEQSQQLREKKDMAEAAAVAKSRFLSAASHDLRQPAHALGLFVSQLAPLAKNARARRLLASTNAAVQEMQNMLESLFDLSQLDAPTTQVQSRPLALGSEFAQLRSGFASEAAAKGLRLRVRSTNVWVMSDPLLLHRILLNLVSNAIRYTESGSVLLACRPGREPGTVRIEVRDSGIGIAPDQHDKIFQEFHQVDNAHRDRRQGLGVGLSVVQRCCRLLNLPLVLRSDLGCGTTFSLSLPLSTRLHANAPVALARAAVPNDMTGTTVLVIEDDAMNRDALAGLLASWGCRVMLAQDLDSALVQCLAKPWPDLIVSDYRLASSMSGLDVILALRAQAGRELPACVISGDTQAQVNQRVRETGLVLLSKPVHPAKLRGLMRHLLLPNAGAAHDDSV